MRLHPDTVTTIKSRISIEEVIQDFIPLKRKGSGHTLWGCCPFHEEKTPSFAVQIEKGFYKCFGCGKAGDAISFLQEREGLSYVESMRYLADKYSIPWEETTISDEEQKAYDEREKLYILLQVAVEYYQEQLQKNDEATQYLEDRGIAGKQVADFQLGYSPDGWRSLYDFARKKGYDDAMLAEVGLIIQKENKVYDRFRGRLLFPLQDGTGRVVGLAGRLLVAHPEQAKYINSPETAIYHKSRLLYGLSQAKASIRKNDFGYLVEGYTDVLAFHKAGIENVVASGGTSLTQEQLLLFKRYSTDMTVVFDGDEAGIQAALRSIDLLLAANIEVKVVVLPSGEDPDSFISERGAQSMRAYLEEHSESFLVFMVNHLLADKGDDPAAMTKAMDYIVATLAKISEPAKRGVYIQLASQLTGLSSLTVEEAVRSVTDRSAPYAKRVSSKVVKKDTKKETAITAQEERYLLHLLFTYGMTPLEDGNSLAAYFFAETADITFEVPTHQALLQAYREAYEEKKVLTTQLFLMSLPQEMVQGAVDIMADSLQLSDGWEKKYQIIPTQLEQVVGKLLHKNILRRKLRVVNTLLEGARIRLGQLHQQQAKQEEMETLLANYSSLKAVQVQIGNQLEITTLAKSFLVN